MGDYIDSRDLIAERATLLADAECESAADMPEGDERDRVEAIDALEAEAGSEWPYGQTFIPESDFVDYAQELAEDIGAIDSDAGWPARCIDWQQAARELRMDYTPVTFDGEDYLTRA